MWHLPGGSQGIWGVTVGACAVRITSPLGHTLSTQTLGKYCYQYLQVRAIAPAQQQDADEDPRLGSHKG